MILQIGNKPSKAYNSTWSWSLSRMTKLCHLLRKWVSFIYLPSILTSTFVIPMWKTSYLHSLPLQVNKKSQWFETISHIIATFLYTYFSFLWIRYNTISSSSFYFDRLTVVVSSTTLFDVYSILLHATSIWARHL